MKDLLPAYYTFSLKFNLVPLSNALVTVKSFPRKAEYIIAKFSGNQCLNLTLSQAKRKGKAQQTTDKYSSQLLSQ